MLSTTLRRQAAWRRLLCADWPELTALVLAEGDDLGALDALRHLLASDYPAERLRVVPVVDRGSPALQAAVRAFAAGDEARIRPWLRDHGRPGKAAALQDAVPWLETGFFVVLDAADRPPRTLLRHLAAPFFDAEVGAVQAPRTAGPALQAWRSAALATIGGWPGEAPAAQARLAWRLWRAGWRRVDLLGACPVAGAGLADTARTPWPRLQEAR